MKARAVHLRYDGSFAGLLTVAAECVRRHLVALSIGRPEAQAPDLFAPTEGIATDAAWSERAWQAVCERRGGSGARDLAVCHLSERLEVDALLLEHLIGVLRRDASAFDPRDPVVGQLRTWRRRIGHEVHQMHAFVRFQANTDGLWTAVIAPAYDVLPLIAPHFRKRFADMRWMILDERRGYALHVDGERAAWVVPHEEGDDPLPTTSIPAPAGEEAAYQTLWRTYFKHVNIPERTNLRLQMRNMPKRHWRHMLELVPQHAR